MDTYFPFQTLFSKPDGAFAVVPSESLSATPSADPAPLRTHLYQPVALGYRPAHHGLSD